MMHLQQFDFRTNNEHIKGNPSTHLTKAGLLRIAEGLVITRLAQGAGQEPREGTEAATANTQDVMAIIRGASRGVGKIARARQRAMYLAHVSCGLSLTAVGLGFGRDRTTVRHACALWEDARDNADIDLALICEEASLQAMAAALGLTHPSTCNPCAS
jgi:hypothetical protein